MPGFDDLRLSTETLRELTPDEMTTVAGGKPPEPPQPTPPIFLITYACPSGATWFTDCTTS